MDIQELIATAKGDRSYVQLALAAGGVPGAARLQQIATAPLKNAPDPPSVFGIAKALGVPAYRVWEAAGASLGIEPASTPSRLQLLLPPGTDILNDEETSAILSLTRLLMQAAQARAEAAAPTAKVHRIKK